LARKILLADDSVTAQNMGRKILADAGYEVITVNNGSAALKRISETRPDLIVLDVYMPGYSGLEVCARLKESGDTSRIPIVLTVGKLEPFKPEEAKRVRADGFIVKPFEASELLSALSKLEDRIVPRPEPAKPGRFARTNAALDAAVDKSVTNTGEDAGWKNRISFPSKKKAAEPEYADDPAIYNPVNKDLRTTIDQTRGDAKKNAGSQETPQPVRLEAKEEARVDLGALTPEGLPKDVTPEEIAALAAAAAQVKGKLSESETAAEAPAPKPAEAVAEAKIPEAKPEVAAAKTDPPNAAEPAKEAVSAVAVEPVSQPEKKVAEMSAQVPAVAASAELAPTAAISATVSATTNSGNGAAHESDVPVTMAVAAGAEHSPISSPRWKAVPVAVLAEEAVLSLEEEMRKALSAVAAAELAHPAPVTTLASTPESVPVAVAEIATPAATAVAEPISPIQPVAQPVAQSEAAPTMSAVATAATDAISEAVKDLEAAAASFTELHKPTEQHKPSEEMAQPSAATATEKIETPVATEAEPAKSSGEPAVAHGGEKKTEGKFEEVKQVEAKSDAAKIDTAEIEEKSEAKPEESKRDESKVREGKAVEVKGDESSMQAPNAEGSLAAKAEEPQLAASASADAVSAETPEVGAEVRAASAPEVSDEPAKPAVSHKFPFGGSDEMGKKESEVAEHTAAAWASWRRIRDDGKSGSSKDSSSKDESKDGSSKDGLSKSKASAGEISVDDAKAAMAVAAGAEKAPEEVVAGEDSEVSAIVDSVLADLRPKIVEEISRKLGKKK
jgi:CheY-like chemotaxis protein